ncbi:MAG: hypothetical protein SFX73_36015 [Kofleriaceae bacterium]|nr:hypothetical protein [Kofleriaceae bacterium]
MRAVWLFALAGCGFNVANNPIGVDADATTIDGCDSLVEQVDTCGRMTSAQLVFEGMYTLNTDTGELKKDGTVEPLTSELLDAKTNGVELRAVFAGSILVRTNTTLRVTGARPIAFVSTGQVSLEDGALIDVSAGGAGARLTCFGGPAPGADDSGGSAGGGGAGFGGGGAQGGNGDKDGGQSVGGTGGITDTISSGPLGGCAGARGGMSGDAGGAGGAGGGAIYIASRSEIVLASGAGINAGGGGGGGGLRSASVFGDAGGGGGGSGGMIWLEAPRVNNGGTLAANGGGGGEGSGNGDAGSPGMPGSLSTTQASGGTGGASAGADGGDGGAGTMLEGERTTELENGGGGGGGGGVGFIRIVATDVIAGTTSPAPTP